MGDLQRRLSRHLHTWLILVLLLSLCAGPLGLAVAQAEAPLQAATPYRFQPWAAQAPSPQPGAPARSLSLAPPSLRQAPAGPGRGYVPLPFDTSHLDNYPQVSALDLTLAAKWDWREQGKVTNVQNQGNCGACYAFATLGSMEGQALIKEGVRYDFSENNLVECNYEQTGCNGGNILVATNRMSTYGAVQESCDPYSPADESCRTSCAPLLVASEMWVLGGNAVPPTDVLKNWLQTYGPLYITMDAGETTNAWGQEFGNYNGSYTIYKPMSSPNLNHAVLLVGWNDGLAHAGGSGAWIVKNSWGAIWGGTCGHGAERGYFTIAYGSAGIGANAAVVRDWRPAAGAGKLLYLDEAGFQGTIGWNGSYGPHGLARLVPPQNGAATQVEFWTAGPGTVDIALYDTFNGQAPSGLLWQRKGISIGYAGYHSVNIDAPVAVQAGNDVNVMIRFNTTGVSYALPIDHKGPVSANKSFASLSGGAGTWVDLAAQDTPVDIGIRLRIDSGSVSTPTFTPPPATPTHTPRPPTPTSTPAPPTKTPTFGPSPTRMRVRLPLMLRQWTVAGPATNTPTVPVPTATPTAGTGSVYILKNASGFMDEYGGLHTVGEVQNDTSSILTGVWVTVRIYDENGHELGSQGGYVLLDNLFPASKTCFHLYHDPIAGAADFDFDPPSYTVADRVPPSLEFVDHGAYYEAGNFFVYGEVMNIEGQEVRDARVVGALYNDAWTVIGCDYAYLDNADLAPGESSTFEIVYTDRDYEDTSYYDLQAEADWP